MTVSEERLEELRAVFAESAFSHVPEEAWVPSVLADAEIELRSVDWDLLHTVRGLGPFGLGNAEPCFIATGLTALAPKELSGGRGLRMRLRGPAGKAITAVGWDLGLGMDELDQPIDALFTVQENVWQGRRSLELRLRDLRPTNVS